MALGIDMATDSGTCLDELVRAGVRWVGRYYRSPASHFPPLSPSELRLLSAHGLETVAIWESASIRASYFTYLAGLDDSTTAYRQARSVGQPAATPIYFAVDFDASRDATSGPVMQYFDGIKAGFLAASSQTGIAYRIGGYGSGRVCRMLLERRQVDYTWLAGSRGWAENLDFTRWNIKQSLTRVPGVTCDHDSNETQGDFGAFMQSAPPAPSTVRA